MYPNNLHLVKLLQSKATSKTTAAFLRKKKQFIQVLNIQVVTKNQTGQMYRKYILNRKIKIIRIQ